MSTHFRNICSSELGATIVELALLSVVLLFLLVPAVRFTEIALRKRIMEGRCTYSEYDIGEPSHGARADCD